MADLVADAILYNTKSIGAQIGLMNVGGVRASLNAQKYGEGPGEITYAEAFDIAPFGNVYVALDLTGAQLKDGARAAVPAGAGSWLAPDAGARCLRRASPTPGTPPSPRARASCRGR